MEFLTVMEQMDLKLIARALKGDIVAYKEVLDRVEGKSKQTIENEISMSMPDLIITPIGPYIKLSSNENEIDD